MEKIADALEFDADYAVDVADLVFEDPDPEVTALHFHQVEEGEEEVVVPMVDEMSR